MKLKELLELITLEHGITLTDSTNDYIVIGTYKKVPKKYLDKEVVEITAADLLHLYIAI